MWWKNDEGSFEEDLKPFRDDGDAYELAVYVVRNNCEVKVLCEPKPVKGEVTFMDKVKEKVKGQTCDEDVDELSECNGDSSDESVRGIYFDDNKEERMKWFDEWVDVGVDGEPRTEPIANSI
ncbi:hypothetical protein KIW84_073011 [Lathyrus oleraceus]|uniref:Uncharacterized protein n=1 Tax=Pisum sativum TaxID=3888 RepID=A0A9D4VN06_PEA|nr:hypothetical protein KIW84_073011 [Pisum sativum]